MSIQLPAVPETWSTTRVDRVASVSARIGWKALTADEYQPDGYAFLSTPNIKTKEIDFKNVNFITEDRYEESPDLKLQKGDILLAKDGNTLGIVNIVRRLPRPTTVNGSIAVIRPFGIDPAFLKYLLESQFIQATINLLKGGMGVPHLFQWDIKRLPVPLPPYQEQRRIADFLDAETARIDRLTDARNEQVNLMTERLDAIRDEVFINGPNCTPTPLMYLTDPSRPIVYGIVQAGPEVQDGVPYIKTGDLENLEIDSLSRTSREIHNQYKRAAVHPGDIVIAMRASIGAVALVPDDIPEANLTQGTARIAARQGIDRRWLLQALQARSVQKQCQVRAVGSTFRTLNIWDLRRVVINVSPDHARGQQLSYLENFLARYQAITSSAVKQGVLLGERRQALITAAVTGQFDVSAASGRGVTE